MFAISYHDEFVVNVCTEEKSFPASLVIGCPAGEKRETACKHRHVQ